MGAARLMIALFATITAAKAQPKNVLYIVYDDLRPDLSAYDVKFMDTPNIQKLADTGTVFERAYCQEAVCSPSRNSFATGRRPNTTAVWNFINHFRNAECPVRNTVRIVGTAMPGGFAPPKTGGWSQTATGGHAQCCTSCVAADGCAGWTYNRNNCTLYSAVQSYEPCPTSQPDESQDTCVSGERGFFPQWTPLPAHFRNNGYLVLGSGKYYHPGGHSAGGAAGDKLHPAGPGTPPMADRDASWSAAGPNGTIQFPDQRPYIAKWGKFHGGEFGPYGNFEYLNPDEEPCGAENDGYGDFCNPQWPLDGTPPSPPAEGQNALADFVTYNDAITKLRFAADNLQKNQQPFFQVVGIKRPHLNWRAPAGYLDKYPIESVAAPSQLTLDPSIDPIAYTVFPMDAPNCTSPEEARASAPVTRTSTDGASTYTAHAGLNCYKGAGGVNIDNSGNATTKSVADCESFCDATAGCFCVVHDGTRCYRRASCWPEQCKTGKGWTAYIKPGEPPAPPAPAPHCENFVKTPWSHGSDAQLRILRQHYYAAVSWADYAAGKVLDELEALGLSNDTMVVLHSDHGWHLGEYAMWEKRTNWELGTRVPLIMRVPWMKQSVGKRSRALVELVDIYQTVSEVMGLPLPNDTHAFDGASLAPILSDPEHATVKDVALSTFPRCAHKGMPVYGARGLPGGADNSCLDVERTDFTWMGYTMRTDRWRYTEWVRWNGTALAPIWDQLKAAELYDHEGDDQAWTDADKFENVNVVKTTDPTVVAALSKKLHAAFGFPDPEQE